MRRFPLPFFHSALARKVPAGMVVQPRPARSVHALRATAFPLIASILTGALIGCLGGAGDGPTAPHSVEEKPAKGKILPGSYAGEYGYIPDSLRRGFDAELILNADGSYRNVWMRDSEAVYDEQGEWKQKGSDLILSGSTESWADSRLFGAPGPLEDDTCALDRVGDSAFSRKEYVPVLPRKRQWTRFHRIAPSALTDGVYTLYQGDSAAETYQVTLAEGRFSTSYSDTIESYQTRARFYQVGSFLALEEIEERGRDSTNAWAPWAPTEGAMLQRLGAVSDTAFDLWYPGSIFYPSGWDHYHREMQ